MNEFEKFQFETLKDYVLEKGWLDRLVLQFNWSESQRDNFEELCVTFADMPEAEFTYQSFARALEKEVNLNYQEAKIIILAFHKNDVFHEIVYKTIKTLREGKAPDYMPTEFMRIEKDILSQHPHLK